MSAYRGIRRGLERIMCLLQAPRFFRWLNRRKLLIVCYHGVRADDAAESHWLLLPRKQLAEQLGYLARHYRCVPVDEALAALRAGALSGPTACVTFDDGYATNRTMALPILESLRVPATIYLTTGLIGTDHRLWTTTLELAILRASKRELDLSALGEGVVPLAGATERRHAATRAVDALKLLALHERRAILDRIHAELRADGTDDSNAFALMGWQDAQAMLQTGLITFGGHTVNHDILSRVDDARVIAEVEGSMHTVKVMLGETTRTFAFPNGREIDFDARAVAAVQRAGGVAAMSTREGLNGSDEDFFALRRVVVGPEMTLDAFRLQTAGVVVAMKSLLRRIRMPAAWIRPAIAGARSSSPANRQVGAAIG